MEVVWSSTAKKSLKATLRYIKKNFGDSVARTIFHEIDNSTSLLSRQPMMGKQDAEHSSENRCIRYIIVNKRSKVYYLIKNNTAYILLVWDVRQDIQSLKQKLEKIK